MVEKIEKLYLTNRDEWRRWLQQNHKIKKEIWLIYYKKHTGKPRIPYADAVEEALCFGWIDSIVKRLDDEKYAQKFTPRSSKSKWSESNIKRAKKMLREGRMTEVGLAKCHEALKSEKNKSQTKFSTKRVVIPATLKRALAENKTASENFKNFAPSYKKQYIGWITSAKREETQLKRINQVVEWATENKKPGML